MMCFVFGPRNDGLRLRSILPHRSNLRPSVLILSQSEFGITLLLLFYTMFPFRAIISVCAITLLASPSANGFSVVSPRSSPRQVDTSLGIFGDALKGAFSNDDSLGKRKDEGLSGGPQYNENVTVNGKTVPGAVVGQKLTVVAGRARVKIPVNCQKGDCGTCMVKMNGRKVKACQTALGAGKCKIETL